MISLGIVSSLLSAMGKRGPLDVKQHTTWAFARSVSYPAVGSNPTPGAPDRNSKAGDAGVWDYEWMNETIALHTQGNGP